MLRAGIPNFDFLRPTWPTLADIAAQAEVGLTATPLGRIDRDTYNLFGCQHKLPTSCTLDKAVAHAPPS